MAPRLRMIVNYLRYSIAERIAQPHPAGQLSADHHSTVTKQGESGVIFELFTGQQRPLIDSRTAVEA